MIKPHRLDPVVKIAKSKEDVAAKALADSRKLAEEEDARLGALLSFRAEYGARFQAAAQAGMSAQQFQGYREFMAQLDAAIEKQRQVVQRLEKEIELRRQGWAATRARSKALHKVIARHEGQEQRLEARREQADADEHAQRTQSAQDVHDE